MLHVIDAVTEEEIGEIFWSHDRDSILHELESGDYIDDVDTHSIVRGPDSDLYVMKGNQRVLILTDQEDEDSEDEEDDEDDDFEDDEFEDDDE